MRKAIIFLMVFCVSCGVFRSTPGRVNSTGKLNITLNANDEQIKLNGIVFYSPDSVLINVYGPLGINLIRLKSLNDSVWIADMQQKKMYISKYRNVSGLIFNMFNGEFSRSEEQLLCALCSFVDASLKCYDIKTGKPAINYHFKNKRRGNILESSFNNNQLNYHLKIEVIYDENSKLSGNMSKYSNFETISLKLQ